MQTIIFDGHIIPNTENSQNNYRYFPANGDKKSFISFKVSTRRPFAKKSDKGYYPTDIIPCKAFGATADFVNEYFKPKDPIIVSGSFSYEQGGTKDDGTTYPNRMVIMVNSAEFCLGNGKNSEANNSGNATPAQKPVSTKQQNPFASVSNPFSNPF